MIETTLILMHELIDAEQEAAMDRKTHGKSNDNYFDKPKYLISI